VDLAERSNPFGHLLAHFIRTRPLFTVERRVLSLGENGILYGQRVRHNGTRLLNGFAGNKEGIP
jgi:hypothetical protein